MEFRVLWSASSNVSFHGKSDWREYEGFGETLEEAEQDLYESESGRSIELPCGLETALEACGFDWSVEVRA